MYTLSASTTRRTGRWLVLCAMTTAFGLVLAGCSADPNATKKAEGDDQVEIGPMPDIDSALIEGISIGTASVEAGGAVTNVTPEILPGTEIPGEALQTDSGREDSELTPWVHLTLASAEKLTLLGSTTPKYTLGCGLKDGNGGYRVIDEVIEAVDAGGMVEGCASNQYGASVQATYKIDTSPYLLWTYASTPLLGNNEVKCTILNAKDWTETKTSPYACTHEWLQDDGHGLNPMPKIKLWRKKTDITVTDPNEVYKILSTYCKEEGPQCTFKAKVQKFQALPKSQWIPYGKPQGNCIADSHHSLKVNEKKKLSWKTMIGVTATGEMHIGPVKAGLEASFEQAWATETEFEEEHEMTIPEGKVAGFYIAAGVLHVEGDFTVTTDNAIYFIPNTTHNLPLTQDQTVGNTLIRTGVVMPAAWNCPTDDDAGNLLGAQQGENGVPDGAEVLDIETKVD